MNQNNKTSFQPKSLWNVQVAFSLLIVCCNGARLQSKKSMRLETQKLVAWWVASMTKVYCHGFESSYLCNDFGDTKVNLGHALAKQSCMAHCRISLMFWWLTTRTTDAQRGNSLHCTAENSIPIPKHILSSTSAQFFSCIFDLCLHWVSVIRAPWQCLPRNLTKAYR